MGKFSDVTASFGHPRQSTSTGPQSETIVRKASKRQIFQDFFKTNASKLPRIKRPNRGQTNVREVYANDRIRLLTSLPDRCSAIAPTAGSVRPQRTSYLEILGFEVVKQPTQREEGLSCWKPGPLERSIPTTRPFDTG